MNENLSLGDMNTLTGDEVNKTNGQLLSVGDKIGGYKVIKQLGAGGMGQVYLVENIHMHKQYALKVLPPNLSQNSNFIDRFKVEARVMADLEHPGIVGVHNIGHDEKRGLYYLAMSYIEAGENQPSDLEVLLKEQKKLPEEEVLKITKQLCSALDYAHNFRGKGIVHRDLKPSNILLDADGNAHIADFGLAKVVGSDYLKSMIDRSMRLTMAGGGANTANMSLGDMNTMVDSGNSSPSTNNSQLSTNNSAGSLIGTYEYMAPEQQDGQEATVQSDIYSLGLIIYRMLTGKKAKGRFKLPTHFGLSEHWDEIVDKALEIEPEDRFESVSEIAELLPEIKREKPVVKKKESLETVVSKEEKKQIQRPKKAVEKIIERKPEILPSASKKKVSKVWLIAIIVVCIVAVGLFYDYTKIQSKSNSSAYASNKAEKEKLLAQQKLKAEKVKLLAQQKLKAEKEKLLAQQKLKKEAQDLEERRKNIVYATELYEKGEKYDEKGEYSKALESFRKAADKGYAKSINLIGVYYYKGRGVSRNYSEAMKWFRKAADKGYPSAMYNIANLYEDGKGVSRNYSEAMKWYKKAAEKGDTGAMTNIGYMYQHGYGVTKDYTEAMKWGRKGADKGNKNAMYNIASLYYKGNGVPKNKSEAIKWIRKAARLGLERAKGDLKNLGLSY